MSAKTLNARVTQKHDTEANWNLATTFVPLNGEIVVYDADVSNPARFKIGDGTTTVVNLPFIGSSDLFLITAQDDTQGNETVIVADKTYGEAVAAISAGKLVYVLYQSSYHFLYVTVGDPLNFYCYKVTVVDELSFYSDNTITKSTLTLGTYSKPSGGIPASDLASNVQDRLLDVPQGLGIHLLVGNNNDGRLAQSWHELPVTIRADSILSDDEVNTLNDALQSAIQLWLTNAMSNPGVFTAVFDDSISFFNSASFADYLDTMLSLPTATLGYSIGGALGVGLRNTAMASNSGELVSACFHISGSLVVAQGLMAYVNGDIFTSVNGVGITGFAMPTTMTQATTLSGTYDSSTGTLNITGA